MDLITRKNSDKPMYPRALKALNLQSLQRSHIPIRSTLKDCIYIIVSISANRTPTIPPQWSIMIYFTSTTLGFERCRSCVRKLHISVMPFRFVIPYPAQPKHVIFWRLGTAVPRHLRRSFHGCSSAIPRLMFFFRRFYFSEPYIYIYIYYNIYSYTI